MKRLSYSAILIINIVWQLLILYRNTLIYGCDSSMKKKNNKNYLDYIPVRNKEYAWKVIENNIVEISVVNKGFFNTIAQKFFKAPKVSKIKLDEYGSIVWKAIDDKRDIGDVAQEVRSYFDDEEKVFYSRLIKFFQILKDNKFIKYMES